jgi:cell division protein FtsL
MVMIRVLNLFCVALMGLSILGLYHVSERTRVAHMQLTQVQRQIRQERTNISVLQTEWQHVASPERIQQLAEARLGMSDTASVQLSSFDQLPRRGEDAPLGGSPVHNASAVVPSAPVSDRPGM